MLECPPFDGMMHPCLSRNLRANYVFPHCVAPAMNIIPSPSQSLEKAKHPISLEMNSVVMAAKLLDIWMDGQPNYKQYRP
jgi:hypothetical protein